MGCLVGEVLLGCRKSSGVDLKVSPDMEVFGFCTLRTTDVGWSQEVCFAKGVVSESKYYGGGRLESLRRSL